MPESEPLASNAVADAILMLAVARHAKDFRHHVELAQVAKEELAAGLESGAMEEEARQGMIEFIRGFSK